MPDTESMVYAVERSEASAPPALLAEELDFYSLYVWCLDPHLTAQQALDHLRHEIAFLRETGEGWQAEEVATNVYLLACALLNVLEEAIRGKALRMPRQLASRRIGRTARHIANYVLQPRMSRPILRAIRWKNVLQAGLQQYLPAVICGRAKDRGDVARALAGLEAAVQTELPLRICAKRIGVPSPFRRLDLTPQDVLALGRRFVTRFPDRSQPVLLLGLRTSGSYFVPLLRAFLGAEGFTSVAEVTIQPDKGEGRQERQMLVSSARAGFMALVLDDSPHTGGTVVQALDLARRAGFPPDKLRALLPVHPANRAGLGPLNENFVVSLAPEVWRNHRLLDARELETRVTEYYRAQGFAHVRVIPSRYADEVNAELNRRFSGYRGSRLKRVHAVELRTDRGETEIRYVLAKSVGCGWLGYHAFLNAHSLAGRVPPVLGLRQGILYSEWLQPRPAAPDGHDERCRLIDTSAAYVAERAHRLSLPPVFAERKRLHRHENGLKLLAKTFSKAYGRHMTDLLARPRMENALARLPCPYPTLIDGKMERSEWIAGPQNLLKTDFEHHGMGKGEINVTDPAYDLANTILALELSPDEEARLVRRYAGAGDANVEQRLFMNKLLTGLWAMQSAQEYLFGKTQQTRVQREYHDQFLAAWNFLTVHAARFCGQYCRPTGEPAWRSPLVVLDVDGVIDRRILGFPCTTAAGIEALSLLHGHGISVALNTARSAQEVRDYCDAYSLAGGVAEHGSYLWDATARRARVLIDEETKRQLEELRAYLRRLPGVFLDHRHHYSIRALTYEQRPKGWSASLLQSFLPFTSGIGYPSPLPTLVIKHCMAELGLDRLAFHNTTIDTTIVARAHDKGTGLAALRDWVLAADAETIAVGDSASDLSMFRQATRSFAPAHIDCGREARLLGCQIAAQPYQRGLLEIVRTLIVGNLCNTGYRAARPIASQVQEDLFLAILRAADQAWYLHLVRGLVGMDIFRVFIA